MKQEKYSRYEFLKKMGFQGGALMAVLASCTHEGDAVLETLIVNKNGETVSSLDSTKISSASTSGAVSGGTASGGTTSGGTTSGGTPPGGVTSTTLPLGKVTTAELAKVSNPLVKLDLTSSSSSALTNTGGYITVNNAIVIGRAASGDYVAASNLCTHEPKRRVIFNKTEYFCTDHGARFSLTGANLNTIARSPLTVYKTANDGKTLIVYA
jgi:nitrite reductase/ring-hydroxylating ferredoxin subunit